jgi:hypothetical protein
VDWIRQWKDTPPHVFRRFCFSSQEPGGRGLVMAEYDDGDYFWVVAYADAPIPGLPEWKETEQKGC